MNVNVSIVAVRKENCLRIPSSAISNGTVEVLRGGRSAAIEVEVGISGGGYTEILSGLTVEDEVILP